MIPSEISKNIQGALEDNAAPLVHTAECVTTSRFHAMDMLRSFAMLLGIVFHASLAYSNLSPSYWPVQDQYRNVFFDFCILTIHFFRMEIFFFMSGFFANAIYQKKGSFGLIKNRLLRVLVPFVISWPLIVVLMSLINIKQTSSDNTIDRSLHELPIFHLWFLYYLLFFYGVYTLWCSFTKLIRYFLVKTFGVKKAKKSIDTCFGKFLQSRYHILGFALITLPVLFYMKTPVIDTPLGFNPLPQLLLYYGAFFIVGCLVNRSPHLFSVFIRNRWFYLAIAIPNVIFLNLKIPKFVLHSLTVNFIDLQLIMIRISSAMCTWSLVLFLIGFFQHYLNKKSMIARYLSDVSYWVYIMHFPLIIVLQYQLLDSALPNQLRFIVIFLVTLVALLLSYQCLIKYTIIGKKSL